MYNFGGMRFLSSAAYNKLFSDTYAKASAALDNQKTVFQNLYSEISTTDASVDLSAFSAKPRMRPMRAGHPQDGGTELGGTLRKVPYKAEMTFDADLIESTNGQELFETCVRDLGAVASNFKMDLINDLILGNGVCWDGTAYFNAVHPTFESSGIQSNLAGTVFGAGAGYVTELPNYMGLLDSQANTMGILPDVILGPFALFGPMQTYFNPNRINFLDSGVAAPSYPIHPIEKLGYVYQTDNNTPSATEWFMFSTRYKKPFVIVQTKAPKISITPLDSSVYITQRQLQVNIDWYGIAGYGPWWLGYQCNI